MNIPQPLTITDGAGASHTLTLEFDERIVHLLLVVQLHLLQKHLSVT